MNIQQVQTLHVLASRVIIKPEVKLNIRMDYLDFLEQVGDFIDKMNKVEVSLFQSYEQYGCKKINQNSYNPERMKDPIKIKKDGPDEEANYDIEKQKINEKKYEELMLAFDELSEKELDDNKDFKLIKFNFLSQDNFFLLTKPSKKDMILDNKGFRAEKVVHTTEFTSGEESYLRKYLMIKSKSKSTK